MQVPPARFVKQECGACPLWHSFVAAWPLALQPRGSGDVQYYHHRFTATLEMQVGGGDWYNWLLLSATSRDVAHLFIADTRTNAAAERTAEMEAMAGPWWVLLWETRKPEAERKCRGDLRRLLLSCTWCPWGAADFEPMVPVESVIDKWAMWTARGADAYHALYLALPTGIFCAEAPARLSRGASHAAEGLCVEDLIQEEGEAEQPQQGALHRFLHGAGEAKERTGALAFLHAHPAFRGLDCGDLATAKQALDAGASMPEEGEHPSVELAPEGPCAHAVLTLSSNAEAAVAEGRRVCASCLAPVGDAADEADDRTTCACCGCLVCASCAVQPSTANTKCEHSWRRLEMECCATCGGRRCVDTRCEPLPSWMDECPHGVRWMPLCRARRGCTATLATTASHECVTCNLLACGECVARLANQRLVDRLLEKAARTRSGWARPLVSGEQGAPRATAPTGPQQLALPEGAPTLGSEATDPASAILPLSDVDDALRMQPSPAPAAAGRPGEAMSRFQVVGALVHPSRAGFAITRRRVGASSGLKWLQQLWTHVLLSDRLITQRARGRSDIGLPQKRRGPDGERLAAERLDLMHFALDALLLLRSADVFNVHENLRPQALVDICEAVVDACAPNTRACPRQSARSSVSQRAERWAKEEAACAECGAACAWPLLRQAWENQRAPAVASLVPNAIPCAHARRDAAARGPAERQCRNAACRALVPGGAGITRTRIWPGPDKNRGRSLSERLGAACEGGARELWMTRCSACRFPLSYGRKYQPEDLFAASSAHARASLASTGSSCGVEDTHKVDDHDRDS